MVHYILQTIAFQLFFLLVYDVFLKRETFFNWNRFYLLFAPIVSLVLPLIKIEAFKDAIPQQYVVQLPAVILNPEQVQFQTELLPAVFISSTKTFWTWEFILYLGIIISSVIFLFKLFKLLKTYLESKKEQVDGLKIVTLQNSSAAFSFFNLVFLGDKIASESYAAILTHERVHMTQKHSADLLFFELLRIVFWFNPLVYMYHNRMVTLHEYIADASVVKQQDKSNYYQNLLSQVFDVNHISFINPFYKQSLIKKRIIMLTKRKSKQIHLVKYALLIPMVFGMLLYTSCDKDGDTPESSMYANEDRTDIIQNIEILKESIAAKGHVTDEEDAALKSLMVLVSPNGFTNPDLQDVVADTEVPFSLVTSVPVFPGCESLDAGEQKKCFSEQLTKFVAENFNTDLAGEKGLSGKQRISVIFKIDSEGSIVGAKARAPIVELEKEALRVVNLLPKMTPGKMQGKNVTVTYSLPIIFQVAD